LRLYRNSETTAENYIEIRRLQFQTAPAILGCCRHSVTIRVRVSGLFLEVADNDLGKPGGTENHLPCRCTFEDAKSRTRDCSGENVRTPKMLQFVSSACTTAKIADKVQSTTACQTTCFHRAWAVGATVVDRAAPRCSMDVPDWQARLNSNASRTSRCGKR
jgi:hypothetical protein